MGVSIATKVRVADVIDLDALDIGSDMYRFGLMAHFDFVVNDEKHAPQFAVEFDGPTHRLERQRRRDEIKDRLCELAGLPLLRVNGNHLEDRFRGVGLLRWSLRTWFLAEGFFAAQRAGTIPPDEPFDPMLLVSLGQADARPFPMWLSADVRQEIRDLHVRGLTLDAIPGEWQGVDSRGNYHGMSWLRVDDNRAVMTTSAVRAQSFPVMEDDMLTEILAFQIRDELVALHEGRGEAVPLAEVTRVARTYVERFDMMRAGWSGWTPWTAHGTSPARGGWYYDWPDGSATELGNLRQNA